MGRIRKQEGRRYFRAWLSRTMPCSGDSRVWTEDRDLEEEIIRVLLNNVSSC